MNYSIVIATRNRLSALRLSVPRMLEQSRPPAQLVVVDSSDDHAAVAQAVREMVGRHPVKLTIKHSERGLTLQRNAGLEFLEHPIVFFPDDDSIWFPGVAENIMTVYERDSDRAIAAVCAAESSTPPEHFLEAATSYRMNASDRLKLRIAVTRTRLENLFVPDPGRVLGRSLIASFGSTPWQQSPQVVPVEWMTGFRMSFRTEVAQKVRFDVNLSRYSLFEDRDASFGAWRHGAVVAALQAKVFHYRSPERRDAGRRMGTEQLLNLAYLLAKHTAVGHPSRKYLRRFGRYKCLLYLLSARDTFGRERFQGAKAALKELPPFFNAPPESAASLYGDALRHCLPEPAQPKSQTR